MAVIEARNLTKIFGPRPDRALERLRAGASKEALLAETGHTLGLNDVSVSVDKGEMFVVMGLSGSGKSTLIRHINRLIDPTDGTLTINGVDMLSLSLKQLNEVRRAQMGMVFQRFALMPHRTVLDNIAFGLEVRGSPRAERHAKAAEWVEMVGLAGFENQYPQQLSGGMQQRVGLARALCTDPEILLMDEAFSALDPLIRSQMQDQLLDIQGRLSKTIMFITHDLDEALRLGDRIAILDDGAISQIGTPQEILLHPANDYVHAFVREVDRGRVLTVADCMTPATDGAPGEVGKRQLTADLTLSAALSAVLDSDAPAPVVDAEGTLIGTLSRHTVAAVLQPVDGNGSSVAGSSDGGTGPRADAAPVKA